MKKLVSVIVCICLSATLFAASTPVIVSAGMRASDPTIMDVVYKVTSETNVVNVRALAFENGTRSFQYVVRPTTFVKDLDGNETAGNIGSNVAANVEHKLAWKVSADWDVDLTKVKFEILVSEQAQLPMTLNHIKAVGKYPALTIGVGEQSNAAIFDALLWHYAGENSELVNSGGSVKWSGAYPNQAWSYCDRCIARNTYIVNKMEALRYAYSRMGYDPLEGGELLTCAQKATRKTLKYNSSLCNVALPKTESAKCKYEGDGAYCVIDLTAGPDAIEYPVSYLDYTPRNGWGDEYKKGKMIFRKIDGNDNDGFYIAIFPTTYTQYHAVKGPMSGNWGYEYYSTNSFGMESCVCSWNDIRGNSSAYNWPTSIDVDPNSFVGLLRARTKLNIDLPTEAQWDRANVGGNEEADVLRVVQLPSGADNMIVGGLLPNACGVYDMLGLVSEWCLDAYDGGSRVAKGNNLESFYRGNYWANRNNPSGIQTLSERQGVNPSVDRYHGDNIPVHFVTARLVIIP